MELPRAEGLEPKRVFQSCSESTTTCPASSSPFAKRRPARGPTPSTEKNSLETNPAFSDSGWPEPVRMVEPSVQIAISSKTSFWAFQS